MQTADRRIKQGNVASMKRWIWLTFVMGMVFLCGQFWDYFTANFGIETNAYGSAFYTMTGFHALHVSPGCSSCWWCWAGRRPARTTRSEHAAVEAATYYWHFVDVVWIGLFVVLFLLK